MGKSAFSNFDGVKIVGYWKRFLMYRIKVEACAIICPHKSVLTIIC